MKKSCFILAVLMLLFSGCSGEGNNRISGELKDVRQSESKLILEFNDGRVFVGWKQSIPLHFHKGKINRIYYTDSGCIKKVEIEQ